MGGTIERPAQENPRPGLIERGATPAEAAYLVTGKKDERWTGQRVELNALDSQQFLDWLEGKLQAHGVKKFIPDDAAAINAAWKRAWRIHKLNEVIAKAAESLPEPPEPPADLSARIRAILDKQSALRWDAALLKAELGSGERVKR